MGTLSPWGSVTVTALLRSLADSLSSIHPESSQAVSGLSIERTGLRMDLGSRSRSLSPSYPLRWVSPSVTYILRNPRGNLPTIERGTDREETIPPEEVSGLSPSCYSPLSLWSDNREPKGDRIGTIEGTGLRMGTLYPRRVSLGTDRENRRRIGRSIHTNRPPDGVSG